MVLPAIVALQLAELPSPCSRRRSITFRLGSAAALLLLPAIVCAQDLEPRAYSASPVGTNFIVANFARLTGAVLTDPSLPITEVQAEIDVQSFGYARSFGLAGRSASVGVVVPFSQGDISGNVFDAPREVHRAGLGDVRMRFAMNFIGAPALTPQEFRRRVPTTSLGASLSIVTPTGKYVPRQLINVGSNRWAFKPEIGLSQPIGNWFAEVSAGVWLFGDNNAFFRDQRRSQAPLSVLQLHAGYNFRPGMWLAADIGRYAGGRTRLNGIANQDRQENSRYGLTLSVPLAAGWSGKMSWSKGWATRAGGDFTAVSLTLQYRWFDR
jgi:hypothetical protein